MSSLSLRKETDLHSVLFYLLIALIAIIVYAHGCQKNNNEEPPEFTKWSRALLAVVANDTTSNPLQKPFSKEDSTKIINDYVKHWNDTATFILFNTWVRRNMTADNYDTLKAMMVPVLNSYLQQCFIRDQKKLFKK